MAGPSRNIFEVFVRARAAPEGPERDAIIEQSLPGSEDRALVHSLLRHDAQADGFLSNIVGLRSEAHATPLVGAALGPYSILRPLGSGGFADVFEAEQTAPVRRRVAVKVLKPYLVTPEVIRRFEAEQQALALMNHPCIASVYDAGGTPDGRPYFVLEFVDGEPITDWVRRADASRAVRLELLAKVCDAVQHAHERGIVHRDIKASNVLVTLVDGVPHPKVIDFGVAKALGAHLTDRSLATGEGQLIGTIATMSPEQLSPGREPVDERSDVYSLGALIFEVLTGSPLYDLKGVGLHSALRLVADGDPSSLTLNARLLGPDLHAIITKATAPERERRYPSARALREDLLSARDSRPILARHPTWAYRTARFAQRNKAVVAALAGVFLALGAGLVVTVVQAARAARAERLAERQRDEYAAVTRETVAALQQAISDIPGTLPVNRVLVQRTIAGLETLARHQADDPVVALELARAYRQLARTQGSARGVSRGDRGAAIESLQRAIEVIRPAIADPVVTSAAFAEYLYCHFDLGDTLMVDGQHSRAADILLYGLRESEAHLARAPHDLAAEGFRTSIAWTLVRLLVKVGRDEEANALVDRMIVALPEFDPSAQAGPHAGGNTIGNVLYLGAMLGLVGRYDDAERMFDRARDEFLQVLGDDPTPSKWHQNLGNSERHRAIARLRAGDAPGAVAAIQDALAAFATARTAFPDDRPLAHIEIYARVTASWAYLESGDPEAAEAAARKAASMAEPFFALEPETNMWATILGCALVRGALATEARCVRDPDSPTLQADLARALADVERAVEVWADGEPPTMLTDDPIGPADALALRDRLLASLGSTAGEIRPVKASE